MLKGLQPPSKEVIDPLISTANPTTEAYSPTFGDQAVALEFLPDSDQAGTEAYGPPAQATPVANYFKLGKEALQRLEMAKQKLKSAEWDRRLADAQARLKSQLERQNASKTQELLAAERESEIWNALHNYDGMLK